MLVDKELLNSLIEESNTSLRKRSHYLLHEEITDDIQSLLFALQPETEITIHRHKNPTETICCLQGNMVIVFFNDQGEITKLYKLNSKNPILKFKPSQWHTYICLSRDTIGWEIKEGPYILSDFESPEWIDRYKIAELKNVIKKRIKE